MLLGTEINNTRKASTFTYDVSTLDDNVKFIKMQINHKKRSTSTEAEKQFALKLFYKSSKICHFLRTKNNFARPCVTLIRQWVSKLDLNTGSSENLGKLLEIRSESMSEF